MVDAPRHPRNRRRWAVGALIGLALVAGLIVSASGAGRSRRARASSPSLVLRNQGRIAARIDLARFETGGRLDTRALAATALQYVPRSGPRTHGNVTINLRYDRRAVAHRIAGAGPAGGTIDISPRAVSADIRAPATGQVERNDCEATALSILLRTSAVRVDQRALQSRLPKAPPLDPHGQGPTKVWGDPDLGFVGRPDGGGPAGGFGVYPGPVQHLALAYGRRLTDLTRSSTTALYHHLLTGHAVMAWVGLSAGPYETWRSPAGHVIRVNFGEHTVVLTGVAEDGTVTVKNPLSAATEHWSRHDFDALWARLGRRALGA
ncbi:MAG: hypothetical protein NVSMB25_18100 [Thermoleophilaceae bacterium]